MVNEAIDVVFTCQKIFQLEFIIDLHLLIFWFSVCKKHFSIAKNILQFFLLFSTLFCNQDVVETIVAKGGIFY
jgi:hypothetical protein